MSKLKGKTTGFILATLMISAASVLAQGFVNRIPATPMEAQNYLSVEEKIAEASVDQVAKEVLEVDAVEDVVELADEVEASEKAVPEAKAEEPTVEAEKSKPVEEAAPKKAETQEKEKAKAATYPEKKKAQEAITGNQYVVQPSDTLSTIASRAGISVKQLKQQNNLNGDLIIAGQLLIIKPSQHLPQKQESSQQVVSRGNREDDLYWLSRIIHAEAQGETYEGKVAVGNVILNRVASSQFPNTVKGVVFDKQQGYTQFSPVIDGSIYNTPSSESIQAAKDALSGSRPVGDALYFLNPSKSTNFWIIKNRKYYKTIGDHDFYY